MKMNEDMCNALFRILPFETKRVLLEISTECQQAAQKHPNWPSDPIHQAAIVGEEAGELLQAAIQHRYEQGEPDQISKEAIQTGAMCLRLLLNIQSSLSEMDLKKGGANE